MLWYPDVFVVCVYILLLKYLFIINTSLIQQHVSKPSYKTTSNEFIGKKTIIDHHREDADRYDVTISY